jgi:hypothetical protein
MVTNNFSRQEKYSGELDFNEFINLEELTINENLALKISSIKLNQCVKLKVLKLYGHKSLKKLDLGSNLGLVNPQIDRCAPDLEIVGFLQS